jgi:hypothetical protein
MTVQHGFRSDSEDLMLCPKSHTRTTMQLNRRTYYPAGIDLKEQVRDVMLRE